MRSVERLAKNLIALQAAGLGETRFLQDTRKWIWQLDRRIPPFLDELRKTRELAPRFVSAIVGHPAPPDPDVRSEYAWAVNEAEGRILVSLTHRVFGEQEGAVVAIEQRFFIDHTLNSMQAAAVFIPIQEGTAVLYANRTATDLVTGFGSSIAKKIGTVLMRREVDRLVDAFLETTD